VIIVYSFVLLAQSLVVNGVSVIMAVFKDRRIKPSSQTLTVWDRPVQ